MADFNDVLLCQITSKNYGSIKAIGLMRSDFSQGTIAIDSFIRPDKIATLDNGRIRRILGVVSNIKLNEVKQRLKSILEIS
jgi:mRNA-degrading endonuclease toxin of MazEF toxin-antitoxin module